MKAKYISVKLLLLACLVLWPNVSTRAQQGVDKGNLVKCSVETETTSWSKGKPAVVTVRIENVSGRDLKFTAMYIFNLHSQRKESLSRKYPLVGDIFWGPTRMLSRNGELVLSDRSIDASINRTHGQFTNEEVDLKAGATLQIKTDLTQLLWEDVMHSVWPDHEFFEQVPPGKYLLDFEVSGRETKGLDYIRRAPSNSVEVNIL